MAVITISRQYASGGNEIALRVCERLGYRIFDKRLMVRAAAVLGLSEQEIFDFAETSYKAKSFLERVFGGSQDVAQVRLWKEDASGTRSVQELALSESAALQLVQFAIRDAYQVGNVVIVGRGGQALLADEPDVLHVRVVAPEEERIQRVKEELRQARQAYKADIEVRRDAQDRIAMRDAASAEYLSRFYNIRWDDPQHYHMVLNTGKLDVEEAADLILLAVEHLPERAVA